jgi:phospholipase/lecithinase/hemolysin
MNDTAAASDSERAYRVQQYKNMEGDRDRIEALQSQLENDLRFMNLELEGREKSGDTNLAELKQQRDALQQVNQQLTSQLNAMNGLIEDVPDEIRSAAA